jgi:iron complex outermembrane receptor protein
LKYIVFSFLFLFSSLWADNLDDLLNEYHTASNKSLRTVDEKLGHVIVYSQKELQLMQYEKISDVLKELPLNNLNRNNYGLSTLSLPGTKSDVSGFFRLFINDHEVSSAYTQSPSLSWGELPLDFVDYIEIYHGNSSFALGNETGVFFIRIYTKKPSRENGTQLRNTVATHGSSSQSVTHSDTFSNGWSYLGFVNYDNKKETTSYKGNTLNNDTKRRYVYFDLQNEYTRINLGYTDVKKENFLGLSLDANPDDGEIESQDYFVDVTHYWTQDRSLKSNISFDVNKLESYEQNNEGLALIPNLDFTNFAATTPKVYERDIQLQKINAFVSKSFEYGNHNILAALNFKNKQYDTRKNRMTNLLNQDIDLGQFNDFDEESTLSVLFQDDYKVWDNLYLVGNVKYDKYYRSGYLDNTLEEQYRVGMIYTPFKNFGLKSFYTKTHLSPTFYNIDYADENHKDMENQKYKFYAIEGVYANDNSKFSVIYNNVRVKDFIYYSPVGFINVDHEVKTEGWTFEYEYELSKNNTLVLNYFTTKLSENINNSNKGGYVKFFGEQDALGYFASLLYRNNYRFKEVKVNDSFNLNLGVSYSLSKNLSVQIKGQNLLDKSTSSLYQEGFAGDDFALKDAQRIWKVSLKWAF